MLPGIKLDQENFEEIMEEARSMISSICPEWTDYNYHDPGITLLELFAWLKEIQQFHMDQLSPLHQQKFLKLLMLSQREARPSQLLMQLVSREPVSLKKGTKFYAGDICFESSCREQLPGGGIRFCLCGPEEERVQIDGRQLRYDGKIRFYPFGKQPQPGNQLFLCMEQPFVPGQEYRMSFLFYQGYEIRRNPISEPPAAQLTDLGMEVYTEFGWEKAKILKDETYGFLQNGRISFRLNNGMKKSGEKDIWGYWMRITLKGGSYDVAPALTGINAGHICLEQRDTRAVSQLVRGSFEETDGWVCESRHFLAEEEADVFKRDGKGFRLCGRVKREQGNEAVRFYPEEDETFSGEFLIAAFCRGEKERLEFFGTGFPNQEYPLGTSYLLPEAFGLLAEDVMEQDFLLPWKRVEDFDGSGPSDLHYMLDCGRGILKFGDGIHGMIPEGKIRITDLCFTRGKAGNVRGETIKECPSLKQGEALESFTDAFGGCDRESIESCLKRFRSRMQVPDRAVSREDYERLVRQTPGLMIQSCRVLPDSDISNVHIAVRPYCTEGAAVLSSAYKKNICAYLEDRRLLGTKVTVLAPEYIEISVYAEVRIHHHYLGAKELVEQEINRFFSEQEREFGKPVLRGKLYGRIDSLSCVKELLTLNIEARGNRINRSKGGDVFLPQNGVLILRKAQCNTVNG